MPSTQKPSIINCHTHVFTGDYVPPYLAKTYIIWPFYHIFSLRIVINILRWYHNKIKPLFFTNTFKAFKQLCYNTEVFFKRNYILGGIKRLIEIYLIISILFYVGSYMYDINISHKSFIKQWIVKALNAIKDSGLIIEVPSLALKLSYLFLILIVFKSVRNVLISALKLFKILPGKNYKNLFSRYVQIGMFAKYKSQSGIFSQLKKQYPIDTQFIILPMDMVFMKAGKLKSEFTIETQMQGLLKIKKSNPKNSHPFVFADPERLKDTSYFDYTVDSNTGHVKLIKGCLMQEYLETHQFSGIKMYPALGYYPFHERLLPLYQYCVQNSIPIMTHCIKGTIFHRGKKDPKWDKHPVFTEGKVNDRKHRSQDQEKRLDFDINAEYIEEDSTPLYLNQIKNIDFSNNFTHPLNYLCLLDDTHLQKVINKASDPRVPQIFYNQNGKFRNSLKSLKICFAHFGGDDQWKRFLESDRDNYTSQLVLKPEKGIDFFKNTKINLVQESLPTSGAM